MKYKEFKRAVEEWGYLYGYKPVINVGCEYIEIAIEGNGYVSRICYIHKRERFIMDLIWPTCRDFSENIRHDLFEIVTRFAATKPKDREDEKIFIIPIPWLVTTDGKKQYLSKKGGYFFASRRDKRLKQTWIEDELEFIPGMYKKYAVELDEDEK